MGIGIPLAVPVAAMKRNQLFQCGKDVPGYIGVGVFVNGDPGRRVGNVDMADPFHPSRFLDD